jgi:hypothetical protein
MRRTIFLALFAALLVVMPSAAHAQSDEDILRDCADDSALSGDYSVSAMRKARENMPAELDEYSDCRDVLSRAISAKTAASSNNSGSNNDGSGGAGGSSGGTGGGSTPTDPAPSATAAPNPTATPSGVDPGIRIGPSTEQDWEALSAASRFADEKVDVNGRPVTPAASVGRNGLPGTLVAVLALLAAAAIAVTAPSIRRRVVARPSST